MENDALRERIVNEFIEAAHDTQKWFNRLDSVTAFNIFLDRNPHVVEGWPDNE